MIRLKYKRELEGVHQRARRAFQPQNCREHSQQWKQLKKLMIVYWLWLKCATRATLIITVWSSDVDGGHGGTQVRRGTTEIWSIRGSTNCKKWRFQRCRIYRWAGKYVICRPADAARRWNNDAERLIASTHPVITSAQFTHSVVIWRETGDSCKVGCKELWTGSDPEEEEDRDFIVCCQGGWVKRWYRIWGYGGFEEHWQRERKFQTGENE